MFKKYDIVIEKNNKKYEIELTISLIEINLLTRKKKEVDTVTYSASILDNNHYAFNQIENTDKILAKYKDGRWNTFYFEHFKVVFSENGISYIVFDRENIVSSIQKINSIDINLYSRLVDSIGVNDSKFIMYDGYNNNEIKYNDNLIDNICTFRYKSNITIIVKKESEEDKILKTLSSRHEYINVSNNNIKLKRDEVYNFYMLYV